MSVDFSSWPREQEQSFVVFEQFNNLHKMNTWSPWARMDPNCKNTFDGPPAGVGSSLAWDGNSQVGAGKMTITDSTANEHIRPPIDRPPNTSFALVVRSDAAKSAVSARTASSSTGARSGALRPALR